MSRKTASRRRRGEPLDERYFRSRDCGYPTPCWVWTRALSSAGYGSVWCPVRKSRISAHVAVYEERVGPIPEGLWIDHLCRNRACVNPDHLEPVTPSLNHRRGANAKLKLHEYDEILEKYAAGASQRSLSVQYGVTRSTIRYHLGLESKHGRFSPHSRKDAYAPS